MSTRNPFNFNHFLPPGCLFYLGFLVLSCCGSSTEPSYTIQHGIEVYLKGDLEAPTKEQAEWALRTVKHLLVTDAGWNATKLEKRLDKHGWKYRIVFKPGRFKCPLAYTESGYCMGTFNPREHKIKVAWHKCPAKTALTHELIHFLDWVQKGTNDFRHVHPGLWLTRCLKQRREDCYETTISAQAQTLYRKQLVNQGVEACE